MSSSIFQWNPKRCCTISCNPFKCQRIFFVHNVYPVQHHLLGITSRYCVAGSGTSWQRGTPQKHLPSIITAVHEVGHQAIQKRYRLGACILCDSQLVRQELSVQGNFWLAWLCCQYWRSVPVLVELQVLPDKLVDEQVFVGQRRTRFTLVIQGAEHLCPDTSLQLAQHTAGLQRFPHGKVQKSGTVNYFVITRK